jgi:D-alanyl-D-alanine carboxypeptidase
MKSWIVFGILSISFLLISCEAPTVGPSAPCEVVSDSDPDHPKADQLQSLLDEYTAQGLPGMAIALRDSDGTWSGAAGMADIGEEVPFAPCTVNKLASVTKVFMGALTMRLVEEGFFGLDDPIGDYLSEETLGKVPVDGSVLVRQLLNHTTGIPEIAAQPQFYLDVLNQPDRDWTYQQLLDYVDGVPATFSPPGDSLRYSNTNILLAAMVMEAATGKHHGELLHTYVLDPLGLENTFYPPVDELPSQVAQGYFDLYNNGTLVNVSNYNTGNGAAYTGLYSNVQDMQRFLDALLREKTLLQPASLEEMLRITALNETSGLAFGVSIQREFLERPEEEQAFGHGGREFAYSADLFYFPEKDITYTFVINYGTNGQSSLRLVFDEFRAELIDLVVE